ncbi:hypothetical protein [Sphingobium sp. MK2]|uniref:hypothetical protein n=1 Tax=Sphingobium sp. MK2 TaxID=3116540 RepID=UPI0032E35E05
MDVKANVTLIMMAGFLLAAPIDAQIVTPPRDVIGAAIVSDIARDRQAEREARRQPYATPGYGPIASAAAAGDACAAKARQQAGPNAALVGRPVASSMSTGWEVEGNIGLPDGGSIPFICSVRNGSVTGIILRQ